MEEVGLRDTVDPLAGSYFVETITKEMEDKIKEEMTACPEDWGYDRRNFVRVHPARGGQAGL